MAIERPEWHSEWSEQKAEIQIKLAELGLVEEYDAEAVYAAMMEYLQQDLESEFRERFGEELDGNSE